MFLSIDNDGRFNQKALQSKMVSNGGLQKFVASIHNTSFVRREIDNQSTSFSLEFINHDGLKLSREKFFPLMNHYL